MTIEAINLVAQSEEETCVFCNAFDNCTSCDGGDWWDDPRGTTCIILDTSN